MSEPMSSVEIEDVLSSIRRLVSDDLRPARPQAAGQAPAPQSAEAASKLILTPSLRIVPGEVEAEVATPDAPVIEEFAPDTVEDLPLTQWTDSDWSEAEAAGFVALDGYEDSDAPVQVMQAMPFHAATPIDPIPADTALEDEADFAELQTETEFAEADSVDDIIAEVVTEAEVAFDPTPAPAPFDPSVVPSAPVDVPEDAWVELAAPDASLQDWQDVLPEAQPEVAPAEAADRNWADAAEAEVLRQLSAEAEATATDHFSAATDDGPLYDEELLRDLVRDIIREELQGTLGERITRNVRKLVRAEIARAMALREFE